MAKWRNSRDCGSNSKQKRALWDPCEGEGWVTEEVEGGDGTVCPMGENQRCTQAVEVPRKSEKINESRVSGKREAHQWGVGMESSGCSSAKCWKDAEALSGGITGPDSRRHL